MSDNSKITALALTGGGARGAYQVGVLSAIAEELPPKTLPFDVITGVSVGAINAASLAAGAHDFHTGVQNLVRIWQELNSGKVYRTDMPHILTRLARWGLSFAFGWAGAKAPHSLLDNTPLIELLETEIDFAQLSNNLEGPVLDALAITASSYGSGLSVSFYQGSIPAHDWQRSRRVGRDVVFQKDHIMASSALPYVFPTRYVEGDYFGDGALRQTAPLSPAIHLGADKLFVIGARDKKLSHGAPPHPIDPYPSPGVISGQLMDIVFNDNLEADVERLCRINHTVDAMLPERRAQTELKHIDIFMIQPTEDIREIAGKHVKDIPPAIQMILKALGAWKAPWVLPSYLMFEPGYTNELVALGRKDAQAQMAEIKEFLQN
ncbi:MAG: patatin-like phospholipase family protein [bacterium]